MANELIIADQFDYSTEIGDKTCEARLKRLLLDFAKEVDKQKASVIETGRILDSANEELAGAGREGKFRPWVETACRCSIRTAYNYISAYRVFGKCASACTLMDDTAMYALSSDKCPEKATAEALRLIDKKREYISIGKAKELIEKHTPKHKPTPAPVIEDDEEDTEIEADEVEEGGEDEAVDDVGQVVGSDSEDAQSQGGGSVVLDAINREVPDSLTDQHATAALILSAASRLDQVKQSVEKLSGEPGGEFLSRAKLTEAIQTIKGEIAQSRYWSECPRCKGVIEKRCDRCDGAGFLPFSRRNKLSAADKLYLGVE